MKPQPNQFSISETSSSSSSQSSLLDSPQQWKHTSPKKRVPSSSFRRERERVHSDESPEVLLKLLIKEEYKSRETRSLLETAISELHAYSNRLVSLEKDHRAALTSEASRGQDLLERFTSLQEKAARASQEGGLHKIQLDDSRREILRLQEMLQAAEKQKANAEDAAAQAKSVARRLHQEKLVMVAKEEGKREGFEEGMRHGRMIAIAAARHEEMRKLEYGREMKRIANRSARDSDEVSEIRSAYIEEEAEQSSDHRREETPRSRSVPPSRITSVRGGTAASHTSTPSVAGNNIPRADEEFTPATRRAIPSTSASSHHANGSVSQKEGSPRRRTVSVASSTSAQQQYEYSTMPPPPILNEPAQIRIHSEATSPFPDNSASRAQGGDRESSDSLPLPMPAPLPSEPNTSVYNDRRQIPNSAAGRAQENSGLGITMQPMPEPHPALAPPRHTDSSRMTPRSHQRSVLSSIGADPSIPPPLSRAAVASTLPHFPMPAPPSMLTLQSVPQPVIVPMPNAPSANPPADSQQSVNAIRRNSVSMSRPPSQAQTQTRHHRSSSIDSLSSDFTISQLHLKTFPSPVVPAPGLYGDTSKPRERAIPSMGVRGLTVIHEDTTHSPPGLDRDRRNRTQEQEANMREAMLKRQREQIQSNTNNANNFSRRDVDNTHGETSREQERDRKVEEWRQSTGTDMRDPRSGTHTIPRPSRSPTPETQAQLRARMMSGAPRSERVVSSASSSSVPGITIEPPSRPSSEYLDRSRPQSGSEFLSPQHAQDMPLPVPPPRLPPSVARPITPVIPTLDGDELPLGFVPQTTVATPSRRPTSSPNPTSFPPQATDQAPHNLNPAPPWGSFAFSQSNPSGQPADWGGNANPYPTPRVPVSNQQPTTYYSPYSQPQSLSGQDDAPIRPVYPYSSGTPGLPAGQAPSSPGSRGSREPHQRAHSMHAGVTPSAFTRALPLADTVTTGRKSALRKSPASSSSRTAMPLPPYLHANDDDLFDPATHLNTVANAGSGIPRIGSVRSPRSGLYRVL